MVKPIKKKAKPAHRSIEDIRLEYLVSAEQITDWMIDGKLNTYKLGNKLYVTQDDMFTSCMKDTTKRDKKIKTARKAVDEERELELQLKGKDIKIDMLLDLVKEGCAVAANQNAVWAKISLDVATLELKRQASQHLPPERYFEIISELVKEPTEAPRPISGYTGEDQ